MCVHTVHLFLFLCWFVLTVNLTHRRITWEESASEGLATSCWPIVTSVEDCLDHEFI